MTTAAGMAGPSRIAASRAHAVRRCVHTSALSSQVAPDERGPSAARLRFAPSPTGSLHLGGLRTALFNHLLARKWDGKWLLRIEDTDRTRLVPGAVDSLRQTLEWAGLDYDEGVGAGGSFGPYVQSERLDLYHHHVRDLIGRGEAYECFCSADELVSIRNDLKKQGHRHTYDGRCRHLTDEERVRRKKAGQKHVVRFKATVGGDTIPPDLIHGDVQFPALGAPDDVVLLKSDGFPTYHLASVVDDHEMQISHVLRGEEWLPSVPKHHALYRAFGWTPPRFAHLPLLINADGTKLSKRTGDVAVEAYKNKGYEPEALLNFLALMGWDHHSAISTAAANLGHEDGDLSRSDGHSYSDLFTIPQLVSAFSLEHVNTKKAAVNLSKLDFINKLTLRRKAGRLGADGVMVDIGKERSVGSAEGSEGEYDGMVDRVQEMLRGQKVLQGNPLVEDRTYVEKVFEAELPRLVVLQDIALSSIFFFVPPSYDTSEARSLIQSFESNTYVNLLQDVITELKSRLAETSGGDNDGEMTEDLAWRAIHLVVRHRDIKKTELITPMRHALTGRKKGPGVAAIMSVIGAQRSLYRLEMGIAYVKQRLREGKGFV